MNQEKLQLRKSIIKLHKKGKSQPQISYLLDVPQTTISYWIRRFKLTGNLKNKKAPGKAPKLTKKQFEEAKKHFLNELPERYGGESLGWTTKLAIKYIKDNYNVIYSLRRMQELFHKFGLSLITPRSEAYKGSKLARNSYREEFKKKLKMNIWVPK